MTALRQSMILNDQVEDVSLPVGQARLAARWVIPSLARGLVICAHEGSKEDHGLRLRQLTGSLNDAGLATLQLNLLSPGESDGPSGFLDLRLLALRLRSVTTMTRTGFDWVGYLAGDVAAAAALEVAADRETEIAAVAAFSGRLDFAGSLGAVRAPTLLVVGSGDPAAIRRNQQALGRLAGVHQMVIIPGAGHLLDESGTLALAAGPIGTWLQTYGERSVGRTGAGTGEQQVLRRLPEPAAT